MIEIEVPSSSHIEAIVALNNKYLIKNLSTFEQQKGFIRIAYNKYDIKAIIENREMVIALHNKQVVGYYLIGKKCEKVELDYQKNKAISLFDSLTIQFPKIGYGCQVCIDEKYRDLGLSKQMLTELIKLVKNKYSILLSVISIENKVSLTNSTALGWTIINEFEKPTFYKLDI